MSYNAYSEDLRPESTFRIEKGYGGGGGSGYGHSGYGGGGGGCSIGICEILAVGAALAVAVAAGAALFLVKILLLLVSLSLLLPQAVTMGKRKKRSLVMEQYAQRLTEGSLVWSGYNFSLFSGGSN